MLDPEVLLMAYQRGFFPMGDERDGQIFWHRPPMRAPERTRTDSFEFTRKQGERG